VKCSGHKRSMVDGIIGCGNGAFILKVVVLAHLVALFHDSAERQRLSPSTRQCNYNVYSTRTPGSSASYVLCCSPALAGHLRLSAHRDWLHLWWSAAEGYMSTSSIIPTTILRALHADSSVGVPNQPFKVVQPCAVRFAWNSARRTISLRARAMTRCMYASTE
jgi:hypothetical protein